MYKLKERVIKLKYNLANTLKNVAGKLWKANAMKMNSCSDILHWKENELKCFDSINDY